MSDIPYLYGLPGAEHMYDSPEEVYELCIKDDFEARLPHERPFSESIEEYSATTLRPLLVSADEILARITEEAAEADEMTEAGYDRLYDAVNLPEVVAAFDRALDVLVAHIPYRMADKHLRDLIITWDTEGNPFLDGEPIPQKRREIPGQEAMFE